MDALPEALLHAAFPLLVCVALGLISVATASLWTRARRRRDPAYRAIHPRCRGCDYLLIGLTTRHCPECGRDLTQPKGITLLARREGRVHLIAFAILLAALAWTWWIVADDTTTARVKGLELTMERPASQTPTGVRLWTGSTRDLVDWPSRLRRRMDLAHIESVQLYLISDAEFHFQILLDGRLRYTSPSIIETITADEFTDGLLARWYRTAGVTPEDDVHSEMLAVSRAIQSLLARTEPDPEDAAGHFAVVNLRYPSASRFTGIPGDTFLGRMRVWPLFAFGALSLLMYGATALAAIAFWTWWTRHDHTTRLAPTRLPLDLNGMRLHP